MENKVSYKKISTFYLLGTLFNKGATFITVPIFTRLLSTSDYGIITTYNSWVSILAMIVSCALHMGIRSAFIDHEKKIDEVMATVTTFTIICGFVMTSVIILVSVLFHLKYPVLLIILCMIHSIGAGLVQNYLMYLQMKYSYKFRTALMIFPNLFSIVFSVVAIMFVIKTNLYMGRIVPTALTQAVFGLLVAVLIYQKSKVIFNVEYIKYTLTISLPLVLHGIALNILSQSDRLMITSLRSASETGIYSLVYNFGMIATVITTALEGVWVPWFMNKLKANEEIDINKRVRSYIELMTLAMAGLILIGPEIIKILADSKYWEGISIVPPIVLANYMIFAYTLYVNVEHYYKKTKYITLNTIIAAVCNIVANLIFIPLFGYVAAAYTTLFSYIIALILHAGYAKKLNEKLYPIAVFVLPLVKLIVSVAILYFFIASPIIRWIVAIIFCIVECISNRDIVAFILPKYSKK